VTMSAVVKSMTHRVGPWLGGAGLILHLLACSQQPDPTTVGADTPSQGKASSMASVSTEQVPRTKVGAGPGIAIGQGAVDPMEENRRPRMVSVNLEPADRIFRGTDIMAVPQALDPDGDEVTFKYQWVINGVETSLVDGAVLRGDQFKRGDEISIHVTPRDPQGEGKTAKTNPVIIPNAPPMFSSNPPMEFKSFTYTYQPVVEDPDGDPITLSLVNAPEGMMLDPKSQTIVWSLRPQHSGTHEIEILAEDDQGGRAVQKYSLSVTIPGGTK
jgi:hypothetical protein